MRLPDFHRDVEEERLAEQPLFLAGSVVSEHLQPVDLDDHANAVATVSASTCSLASCTRRIVAPCS